MAEALFHALFVKQFFLIVRAQSSAAPGRITVVTEGMISPLQAAASKSEMLANIKFPLPVIIMGIVSLWGHNGQNLL